MKKPNKKKLRIEILEKLNRKNRETLELTGKFGFVEAQNNILELIVDFEYETDLKTKIQNLCLIDLLKRIAKYERLNFAIMHGLIVIEQNRKI